MSGSRTLAQRRGSRNRLRRAALADGVQSAGLRAQRWDEASTGLKAMLGIHLASCCRGRMELAWGVFNTFVKDPTE